MNTTLRKLLIRTWFGPLPPWFSEYTNHISRVSNHTGFDFMIVNDYEGFRGLVRSKLGVDINVVPGSRKAGDFDPAYGVIFEDYLKEYDFWGHTGLDCVYGRLDRYVSDEFLAGTDIFGNDPNAICGPFSLYRNTAKVNNLFRAHEGWKDIFESSQMYGFDEIEFSAVVRAQCIKPASNRVEKREVGKLRFRSAFWQSHDKMHQHLPKPNLRILEDGTLMDTGLNQEIMMFHFNRPVSGAPFGGRTWPVS